MWNLVKIDGYWYHLDATWNDADGDGARYDYFNLMDEEIGLSHVLSDNWLKASSTRANYFHAQKLYFDKYDKKTQEALSTALRENLKNGVYRLEMRFSSADEMQTAKRKLTNSMGGDIYRMLNIAALSSRDPIKTNEISFNYNEELGILRFGVLTK